MQEVHHAVFWLFGLIQFSGWACGFMARCSETWRRHIACHLLFAVILLAVGISTSLALALGAKYWLLSSATLAGMILLAIWDFDHSRRPATI